MMYMMTYRRGMTHTTIDMFCPSAEQLQGLPSLTNASLRAYG